MRARTYDPVSGRFTSVSRWPRRPVPAGCGMRLRWQPADGADRPDRPDAANRRRGRGHGSLRRPQRRPGQLLRQGGHRAKLFVRAWSRPPHILRRQPRRRPTRFIAAKEGRGAAGLKFASAGLSRARHRSADLCRSGQLPADQWRQCVGSAVGLAVERHSSASAWAPPKGIGAAGCCARARRSASPWRPSSRSGPEDRRCGGQRGRYVASVAVDIGNAISDTAQYVGGAIVSGFNDAGAAIANGFNDFADTLKQGRAVRRPCSPPGSPTPSASATGRLRQR